MFMNIVGRSLTTLLLSHFFHKGSVRCSSSTKIQMHNLLIAAVYKLTINSLRLMQSNAKSGKFKIYIEKHFGESMCACDFYI